MTDDISHTIQIHDNDRPRSQRGAVIIGPQPQNLALIMTLYSSVVASMNLQTLITNMWKSPSSLQSSPYAFALYSHSSLISHSNVK